ncbi:M16 family metallopeptidase [Candidatus Omnitrophota bacterium]
MHKKITLKNGLRIVLHHMSHMESTVIGVWIGAGSRNENKSLCGISHFLEHIVFKGTPTRGSRQIKEEIEGRGGSLNGFTSEEVTCYLSKVSGNHAGIALDVLSDMALNASMRKQDIERERGVITEEIKMYRDLPHHQVHDTLYEIMWPSHPLGLPIAGSIESVNSMTRQDLADYKNEKYISKNIVLVLCGNLKEIPSVKKIEKLFPLDPEKTSSPVVGFENKQIAPQLKIFHKQTAQTRISMGLHAFGRRHKDRYALSLLHIILGANMSSRLFEKVREQKGLAYEIGTEVKRHDETGGFIVNAGIEHTKLRKAISLIIKELRKIKTSGVTANELKMAKEFFRVQLLLALEDTMERMLWLGDSVVALDKLPDKADIIKKIAAISSEDLLRVSKHIFDSKGLNLAVVGPINNKEGKDLKGELEEL